MTSPFLAGLTFPTSIALSGDGSVFVAEAGLPFGGAAPGGRVWRVVADGSKQLVADGLRAPVNGLSPYGPDLLLAEGGHPGRISVLTATGERRTLLDGLPGPGNYHTNTALAGPDGWIYFSQGAMTNTGIVGLDSYEIGWLGRLPHAHDLPGYDVVLAAHVAETADPFAPDTGARARTGGFAPFGVAHPAGHRIPGQVPATAAVMRCRPDGTGLEVVAWGLRNAWALGFLPDGRLLAIDQGADDRGSRPVGAAPDALFEVRPGAWYGWPDFVAGRPVTDPRFLPGCGPEPVFLLAHHDELPPPERPLVEFAPHVAAVKFDVYPEGSRYAGQLLVALFGDEAPMTVPGGGASVGRALVRVDTGEWTVHPVALDAELARPIDVRFDPADGTALVLDFGRFEMTEQGVRAEPGSGALWRLPTDLLEQ
ncbi:MAG: hypothetical protein WD794_14795 [Mycobacteriales bacterium]